VADNNNKRPVDEVGRQRAIKRLREARKAQQVTDQELMERMAELEQMNQRAHNARTRNVRIRNSDR
jgi:hypothetical protein